MKAKTDTNCRALGAVLPVIEQGLQASVANLRQDMLNHVFVSHKMTIGQLAVHTGSWPRYFLSDTPPWQPAPHTCRPCTYPITPAFVTTVITDGFEAMSTFLVTNKDEMLDKELSNGWPAGYTIYRLLLHTLVHANQIAMLRGMLEPSWNFGNNWDAMASALIGMPYHTSARGKGIG